MTGLPQSTAQTFLDQVDDNMLGCKMADIDQAASIKFGIPCLMIAQITAYEDMGITGKKRFKQSGSAAGTNRDTLGGYIKRPGHPKRLNTQGSLDVSGQAGQINGRVKLSDPAQTAFSHKIRKGFENGYILQADDLGKRIVQSALGPIQVGMGAKNRQMVAYRHFNHLAKGGTVINLFHGLEYKRMMGNQQIGILLARITHNPRRGIQCKHYFFHWPGWTSHQKPRIIPTFRQNRGRKLIHERDYIGYNSHFYTPLLIKKAWGCLPTPFHRFT